MQIADQETLENILVGLNSFEYTRKYKALLSQIHADLLSRGKKADLRESLKLVGTFLVQFNIRQIIQSVGLDNFMSATSSEMLAGLDKVRAAAGRAENAADDDKREDRRIVEVTPEAPSGAYIHQDLPDDEDADLPGGLEDEDVALPDDQEEEIEEAEEDLDTQRMTKAEADLVRLSPPQTAYPKWRVESSRILLGNISKTIRNIKNLILPFSGDPTESLDFIDAWVKQLEDMSAETVPPTAELPVEKPKRKKKDQKVRILKPNQTSLDEDDEANLEERGRDASDVDDPTAILQAAFLSGMPAFVELGPDGVPYVNAEGLSTTYNKIREALLAINRETESVYERDKARAGSSRQKFNKLFHAVKAKDWETRLFVLDNRSAIMQALGGQKAFSNFNLELTSDLLSTRLRNDTDLFDTLYYSLAFCINYSLFGHITGSKAVTFKTSDGTNINNEEIDNGELRNNYLARARSSIRSKYFEVFDVNSPSFYSDRKDTIQALDIKTGFTIQRAFRSLHGKQSGVSTVYSSRSNCPVCYKEINWTTPKAKKADIEYRGFDVPMVVPYNVETDTPITTKKLQGAGPFNAPAVGNYQGAKTWDEIRALIASNSIPKHEEGWQRRAAAISQLGGRVLGTHNVNQNMFRCPYPTQNSSCGISLQKLTRQESLVRPKPGEMASDREKIEYALELISANPATLDRATVLEAQEIIKDLDIESYTDQTEVYNVKRGLRLLSRKVRESADYTGIIQPGWTPGSLSRNNGSHESRIKDSDADLRDHMKSRGAGGYKFSKNFFRCPCRISPDMIKDEVSGQHVNKTHTTYAIPYTGIHHRDMESTQPLPTNPLGEPDADIPDGSLGYLVCGAQTSLSSFDRNPQSSDGFISMMREIHKNPQNPGLFVDLLEYFLKEGVDVSDIMSVLPELVNEPQPQAPTTVEAARIRSRITKLSKLISEGMAKAKDPLFNSLKGFLLVCPFGHRFKIEDSIKFGESHMSMSLRGDKMSNYRDIVSGKSQAWEHLRIRGDIMKLDPLSTRRYVYYDEWMEAEPKDREVNAFRQRSGLAALAQSDPEEYKRALNRIVYLKIKGPDGDYVFKDSLRLALQAWSGEGSASAALLGRGYYEGIRQEVLDTTLGRDGVGITTSERQWADDYRKAAFDIDSRKKVSPIPGSISIESHRGTITNLEDYCNAKTGALARALRSALNVIAVWNNGIVDTGMAEVFLITKKTPVPLEPLASKALAEIAEIDGAVEVDDYVASNVAGLVAKIESYVETFSVIKPWDTSKDIAVNVLSKAIKDFVESDETGRAILPATAQRRFINRVERAAIKFAEGAVGGSQKLLYYLASTPESASPEKKKRAVGVSLYIQKMFLLAFSSYMASAISEFAQEYLVEGSDRYIGYDIGVDLTDPNTIMNMTQDFLDNIDEEPLHGQDYESLFLNEDDELTTDKIDRAYQRLVLIISWANRFATTPQNISRAKEFVGTKLSESTDQTSEWIVSELNKFFPVANMPLRNSNVGYIWNNQRVPKIGTSGYQITDMPDTRYPNQSHIVNPELNFDSSKMQIGMVDARSMKQNKAIMQQWPAVEQGYGGAGFVGISLPFHRGTRQAKSTAAQTELKVLDFSVVVDLAGEPVDISFLFQRGLSEPDYLTLYRVEGLMEEAVQQYSRAIEKIGDLKGEAYDDMSARLKEAHDLRMEELRSRRNELPLRFKTTTGSYRTPSKRPEKGSLEFYSADIFEQLYAQRKGKLGYAGYPSHRQADAKTMIPKVMSLYKRYARDPDPQTKAQIQELTFKLHTYSIETGTNEISLLLTDPHNAYRLINNSYITGSTELSDSVKAKLIDFIINVYGVRRVMELSEEVMGREVGIDEALTMIDPRGIEWSQQEINQLNDLLRVSGPGDTTGWMNHPGKYYDVREGPDPKDPDADQDIGSYIQYVYGVHTDKATPSEIGPDGVATMGDLASVRSGTTGYGMSAVKPGGSGRKASPEAVAKLMANRARRSILKFVEDSASGATSVEPRIKESEVIDKMAKRLKILAGIMLNRRLEELDPEVLVREAILEAEYDHMIRYRI